MYTWAFPPVARPNIFWEKVLRLQAKQVAQVVPRPACIVYKMLSKTKMVSN